MVKETNLTFIGQENSIVWERDLKESLDNNFGKGEIVSIIFTIFTQFNAILYSEYCFRLMIFEIKTIMQVREFKIKKPSKPEKFLANNKNYNKV